MSRMKAKIHLVFSIAIFFISFSSLAQKNYWKKVQPSQQYVANSDSEDLRLYELDAVDFYATLQPKSLGKHEFRKLVFPDFLGKEVQFQIEETPVFHPDLTKKYPNIRSYSGWSVDGKQKIRFSISHRGVQVMVSDLASRENTFIAKEDGASTLYKVYKKKTPKNGFVCKTPDTQVAMMSPIKHISKLVDDQTLRKYRIAVSATGEYTQHHGGKVADALAAINATLTRVNEVFETDLGITLELIADNDKIIFTDPESDPYSGSLNSQVQSELTSSIGEENYDVGHLFHNAANGGNAGFVGAVCVNGQKGSAYSSGEEPEGDVYDLDYVAHELGHQFGANHTWSFESEGTGMQAEPASGTTIMGYAGIVNINNVAPNGDDYFHYNSIQQITNYTRSQSCSQDINLTNSVPVVTALPDYTIPVGTAFVLTGEATDADATNVLTYTWEQIDDGVVTADIFGPENPVGANFRSLPPGTNPSRYFPRLSRIIAGQLTQTQPAIDSVWETVSNVGREYNFALTVRDNASGGGQVASELVKVDVVSTAGPFVVTSQTEGESYLAGDLIDVGWDVANTDQAPINAEAVDILLSIDGGFSYPYTLATAVPNVGAAKVQLPGLSASTTRARLMVKASDNVFFALNPVDFQMAVSDVVLNFSEFSFDVCKPNDLSIAFVYETYGGFVGTTAFTVDAPTGVVVNLDPSSVAANNTNVTLDLTNLSSLSVGSYPLTINATSGNSTFQTELQLHIYDTNFGNVVLTTPMDLATNTRVNPEFSWQKEVNANAYDIEIATDEAFTSIVESASVQVNSYTSGNLSSETTYYWRVRSKNDCGMGNFGPAFRFTTTQINCQTFDSEGLPLPLSEGVPSTVRSSLPIIQDLFISEVELHLNLDHSYLSDLIINLISPSGTKVTMTSKSCGNLNNINAVFADDGAAIVCSGDPAISGRVQPLGKLSSFKGESTLGDWVLEIEDTASGDGGVLNDFSIVFCVEGQFRPDEDNDKVFDDGDDLCLGTPKGVEVNTQGCPVYRFAHDNFAIEISSETCRSNDDAMVHIAAVDTTLTYTAMLTGGALPLTETFSETGQFSSLNSGSYVLCITGTDGTVNYEESCFDVVLTEPDELNVNAQFDAQNLTANLQLQGGTLYNVELNGLVTQTREPDIALKLINGMNRISVYTNLPCQGKYETSFYVDIGTSIIPNPTQDSTTVFLSDFRGTFELYMYSYDGRLVKKYVGNTANGAIDVDVHDLTSGLYFIKIAGNGIEETFKILKR